MACSSCLLIGIPGISGGCGGVKAGRAVLYQNTRVLTGAAYVKNYGGCAGGKV